MEGSSTEADGQFDALFDEIARTLGQELDEAASGWSEMIMQLVR